MPVKVKPEQTYRQLIEKSLNKPGPGGISETRDLVPVETRVLSETDLGKNNNDDNTQMILGIFGHNGDSRFPVSRLVKF